ncbi:MAG TPA: transposase [Anaerolineae bacterium]|nr:transposase [Anaerolineae bacterium]
MYEYRKLTIEERIKLVEERRQLGFPPHDPPHPIRDATYYLLTATCFEHQHHMRVDTRRRQVLDMLFEQCTLQGVEIRAWVVVPNHYHILAYVPDFDALSDIFRKIHGPTSRWWNQEDDTAGRKVWYRYADRAIRSDRHYYTTLNYIHYNPVKHHWVDSPYDWQESSLAWYLSHYGREWLRELWVNYPLRSYGEGWDCS